MENKPLESACSKLRRLFALAEELKRSEISKVSFGKQDWDNAVAAFETSHDSLTSTGEEIGNVLRAAANVVRRLGNAGDARFESYGVGRNPDSSYAGKRFHSDLKKAHRILKSLLTLSR